MSVQLGFKANEIIAEGRVTDDEIKQIDIWLREQENLPIISDEEIVNFLLSNDNDQEKTKETIRAYFKIRNQGPDIFNDRLTAIENLESTEPLAYFGVAPNRTKDNCAVILARLHDTSFQNFNLSKLYKLLYMTLDAAIYSSPPSEIIIVLDMEGFRLSLLMKFRIHAISICFRYLQEGLPVKLKNIHMLNTPYYMDKVLAIMKPFMSDHVKELMICHKTECMDDFFEKYVAKQLLPEEWGGELPCLKDLNEQLIKNFKTMEPYFTAEEERRSTLK